MAKKTILDGKFRISLRQSRKIMLAHFVPIKGKKVPPSPESMLIRGMLSEALVALPTLIEGWGGEGYMKGEDHCLLLNNAMSQICSLLRAQG